MSKGKMETSFWKHAGLTEYRLWEYSILNAMNALDMGTSTSGTHVPDEQTVKEAECN